LDDWEWGVTLMAQQLDAVKEIVYEMRLDEVSAKYAEFGPFYINLRLEPEALWKHLGL
jgi:chlorite dismutase